MSLEEPIEARDFIIQLIAEKQVAAREALKAEMMEKAMALGLELRDLFGVSRGSRLGAQRSDVNAKYRDPVSGSEWSGRGRTEKWITAYEA